MLNLRPTSLGNVSRLITLTPFLVLGLWSGAVVGKQGLAQNLPEVNPNLILAPVELEWLNATVVEGDRPIVTSAMVSLSGLTPPSLWWTQQPLGGKLLRGWIAYPETETQSAYVDLVVNRQLWNVSDYLERYSFVHHFGQSAQSFGYVMRVFNDVGQYLAVYPCVDAPATASQRPDPLGQQTEIRRQTCSVILNSSGLGVLQDSNPLSDF